MFRGIKKIAAEIAAFKWWYVTFALCAGVTAKLFTDNTLVVAAAAVSVPLVIVVCVTSEMTLWTMTKFVMLFAAIAGFVSYNFGMIIGLPVAVFVIGIVIVFQEFFSDVAEAFVGFERGDGYEEKKAKIKEVVVFGSSYTLLDYWLAMGSAMVVSLSRYMGLSTEEAFWPLLVYNYIVAGAFLAINDRTGKDITLGRAFRRAVDLIMGKSMFLGCLAVAVLIVRALAWDGPERIVIFMKKTNGVSWWVLLFILTAIQSMGGAYVYGLGYDNISDLWRYIREGIGNV